MHDVNKYYGDNKPAWEPYTFECPGEWYDPHDIMINGYPVHIIDNAMPYALCDSLIEQFEQQQAYPVGVDGFCNAESNVGSYRAMGWSPEVARVITSTIRNNGAINRFRPNGKMQTPLNITEDYWMEGSTPWLRFMKYKSGGMHTPHHDAPYVNDIEQYATLCSWVLYLNTPMGNGGEFQFVNDVRNEGKHPSDWDRSDWTEMSDDVIHSVPPRAGRLLVFPHWLCHQVQEYIGEGYRYIIRGDLAYTYGECDDC